MTEAVLNLLSSLKINDTEIATCTFEIENFKDCKDLKYSEFTLPNNDKIKFRLLVYPKAWLQKTFIYLAMVEIDKQIEDQARFTLSILDKNGEKCYTIDGLTRANINGAITWSQITIDHGYLIDPSSGLLSDGKLSVYCEIYYGEKSKPLATSAHDSDYDCKNIANDFKSLLKDSQLSDVVLLVKEKEFKVHKCILVSRSPYYAAMFTGDFKEKTQNRIEITDVDLDVFEELLFYIYTGKIPSLDKFAFEIFIVSDKYQLESLKSICEKHIVSSTVLEIATLPKTLIFADMHNFVELKSKCVEFFANNSVNVIATEGWKELTKQRADLAIEIFQEFAQKAHPVLIEKNNKN